MFTLKDQIMRRSTYLSLMKSIGISFDPTQGFIVEPSIHHPLFECGIEIDGGLHAKRIEQGKLLKLRLEQRAWFTDKTVALYAGRKKIGFISDRTNKVLLRLIDKGLKLAAVIKEVKQVQNRSKIKLSIVELI